MKTAVFLQARLGSTRLPGKALLELEGKAIITHAMEALGSVETDDHVLLTDHESYSGLKPLAEACGFSIFEGSAEDVLDRFIKAAEKFGPTVIIRATGDNPLVDSKAAAMILASHIDSGADYSGYDDMPLGTGVEVLNLAALQTAAAESDEPYDHEHVSPYLYRNPDRFRINRIRAPEKFCFPGSSVTVDTAADYKKLQSLYSDLYEGRPLSITEIIPWLKSERRSG